MKFTSFKVAYPPGRAVAWLTSTLVCSQLLVQQGTLADAGDSYTPGQAIKLHDYNSHSNSSQPTDSSNGNSGTSFGSGAGPSYINNNSSIDWKLPSAQSNTGNTVQNSPAAPSNNSNKASESNGQDPVYFPSPEELSKMTEENRQNNNSQNNSSTNSENSGGTSAPGQSSSKRPKSRLSHKVKHFAEDFVSGMTGPTTGGGNGSGSSSSNGYAPGSSSTSQNPGGHTNGGGGSGYGGHGPAGEIAQELQLAQQAEQAGNYYQAAHNWWYAVDLSYGGMGYKERADFWVNGRVGGMPVKEVYKHALRCHVIMYRAYLDTGKTWGLEREALELMGVDLFKDLNGLQMSDPENASWFYLAALNAIGADNKELAHTRAFWDLGAAIECKDCSPELKKKCQVLREHIRLAALVELADENRAKFENMGALVWGIEHPHTVIYKDNSGATTHVITCAGGMYTCYYAFMKEMLQNEYPKFKASFAKLLAYVKSQPNNAVAIPPGDGSPDIVEFKQHQVEEKCYAPVVYRIHGNF